MRKGIVLALLVGFVATMITGCGTTLMLENGKKATFNFYESKALANAELVGPNPVFVLLKKDGGTLGKHYDYKIEKFSTEYIQLPGYDGYEELLISNDFTNVAPAYVGAFTVLYSDKPIRPKSLANDGSDYGFFGITGLPKTTKKKKNRPRKLYVKFECTSPMYMGMNDYSPCTSSFTDPLDMKKEVHYLAGPCTKNPVFCQDGRNIASYWVGAQVLDTDEIARAVQANDIVRKAKEFYQANKARILETAGKSGNPDNEGGQEPEDKSEED